AQPLGQLAMIAELLKNRVGLLRGRVVANGQLGKHSERFTTGYRVIRTELAAGVALDEASAEGLLDGRVSPVGLRQVVELARFAVAADVAAVDEFREQFGEFRAGYRLVGTEGVVAVADHHATLNEFINGGVGPVVTRVFEVGGFGHASG